MEAELEEFDEVWAQITARSYWEWEAALAGIVWNLTPSPHDADLRARVVRDLNGLLAGMGLHVRPFGSMLSNMGFPDSDVDLLLAGNHRGQPAYLLSERNRKDLLRQVGRTLQMRNVVRGQVEYILGARVPLLKFVHAATGIECDLSLQAYDGALKGRFMAAAAQLDTRFPALFRLAKLWARAHECNDASQATLNSTALMYMVVFFLQQRGVLPPLRALCPDDLCPEGGATPGARLLDGHLRQLWVDEAELDRLISEVDAKAAAVNDAKQVALAGRPPRGPPNSARDAAHARAAVAAVNHSLAQLLGGFLVFWDAVFGAWAEGRLRDWRPNCWDGCWARQRFAKPYLCPLEDPFDSSDNAARAVGSESFSPGDQHLYIAAVMGANAAALRRLLVDGVPPGGGAPDAGVRVLHGLAWTFGMRGILLLQPPLPPHQIEGLERAAGAAPPGGGGSALRRLLAALGAEVLEEDILDHGCWRAVQAAAKAARKAEAREQEGAQGQPSATARRQQARKQAQANGGGAPAPAAARNAVQPQQPPQQQQPPPPPPPRQKNPRPPRPARHDPGYAAAGVAAGVASMSLAPQPQY